MLRRPALVITMLICCFVIAPALYACEDCVAKGTKDRSGGTSDWNRCYAWSGGMFEICYIDSTTGDCVMEDTDPTACPISTSGGSDGSTGGTTCVRDATGMCPAQCQTCGGGGGGGFLI